MHINIGKISDELNAYPVSGLINLIVQIPEFIIHAVRSLISLKNNFVL